MSLRQRDVTLSPLESGLFIYKHRDDIEIHRDKCIEIAQMVLNDVCEGILGDTEYKNCPLHPHGLSEEEHLNWVFLLDTLNFSFWPDEGKTYNVTYKEKVETGYLACCAAFCKAHDAGVPITSAEWMENVRLEEINRILMGDDDQEIPLIIERHRVLQESGIFLNRSHGGQFWNVVKKSGGKALTLLKFIMMIESFRDCTMYKGQKVSLMKRAQILIADTYMLLKDSRSAEHKAAVAFPDIAEITMFADYRVPQVLCFLGAFTYSDNLKEALALKQQIPHGDELEVQLRGCSIFAVQVIYEEILRERQEGYRGHRWEREKQVLPIDIDVWLWMWRRCHVDLVEEATPFHRTRCIYY